MAVIEFILRHPLALALGWALLHFVWQGAILGAAAAALLRAARDASASVRYAIGAVTMAAMVVSVGATWSVLANRGAPVITPISAAVENTSPAASVPTNFAPASVARVDSHSAATPGTSPLGPLALSVFLLIYASGVALLSIRLAGGWFVTRRLTRRLVTPAAHNLLVSAGLVSERLQLRGLVRIVQSSIVSTPAIVGCIAPIVLLPASALAGLSTTQIEALLAHELAHIKRHDYLVNLVQSAIETLLFYHPAVWWVSRQIRIEREHCCDDAAVAVSGDRMAYASALVDLETMRHATFALAATDGSLASRVRRILAAPAEPRSSASGWMGVALVIAMMAVVPVAMSSARATKAMPSDHSANRDAQGTTTAKPTPPVATAQQKPGPYLIRSSDTLHIVVADEPTMTRNYTVQADGVLVFPLIRPLKVVGLTTDAVAESIAKALAAVVPTGRDFASASAVAGRLESYRAALVEAQMAASQANQEARRLLSYRLDDPATNVETCGVLIEPEVRSSPDVSEAMTVMRNDRAERKRLTEVDYRGPQHPLVIANAARIAADLEDLRGRVSEFIAVSTKNSEMATENAAVKKAQYNAYEAIATRDAANARAAAPSCITVTVVKPRVGRVNDVALSLVVTPVRPVSDEVIVPIGPPPVPQVLDVPPSASAPPQRLIEGRVASSTEATPKNAVAPSPAVDSAVAPVESAQLVAPPIAVPPVVTQAPPLVVQTITVNGEVVNPGKPVPWVEGMTVGDAINAAGGTARDASPNRTRVERRDPATNKVTILHPSQAEVMKAVLKPGDVVVVPKKYF